MIYTVFEGESLMTGSRSRLIPCATAVFLTLACTSTLLAQGNQIQVVPHLFDQADQPRFFGAFLQASDGYDAMDEPEPPAPPGACPLLALVMPGYDGPLPNLWRQEYRNLESLWEHESALFEVRLCVSEVPVVVTLDVSVSIEGFPIDQLLFYPDVGEPQIVSPPTQLELTLTDLEQTVHFELQMHCVPAQTRTWSALKADYR